MKFLKHLCLAFAACASTGMSANEAPLWMRYPAISPDGQQIAFCYRGDIFTVSTNGGAANQLTTHAAYDTRPIWSPDSKTIAFSSTRDGGMDIYTVSVKGGTPHKVTTFASIAYPDCFTPDGKNIIYRTKILPDANYSQFPAFDQVYSIPVEGGRPKQFLTFEAYNLQFNKAGDKVYYHDKKGFEDEWRKHHTSSVCRDIWEYDMKEHKFTNLTNKQVEDRYPVLSADQKNLYFLSERFGSFNVCKMSLDNPKDIKQVTRFTKHPVRFLTRSKDDLLCFFYDGEIYTMKPGSGAKKVDISIHADNVEPETRTYRFDNGASEILISPNEKEFAFIIRGDVFVANIEFGTTRRITNTAAKEKDLTFSPDGRGLVYSSERDGQWNLYGTILQDPTDKNFVYAKNMKEFRMTAEKKACAQPIYSPNGREMAYLYDRTEIRVLDLAKSKSRVVLPGKYNYSYADGDQTFDWSPDGQWIMAKYFEEGGWQHPDICLAKADGSGEIHNLTNSGYSDVDPRWMMGGKAIIWQSDRAGMRSHGSWGSERDVYALFLDPEAFDLFRMSKEDKNLYMQEKKMKEEEKRRAEQMAQQKKSKKEKKADQKAAEKMAKKQKKGEPAIKLPTLNFDFHNLENRMLRLTMHSSNLVSAVLSNDGERLYYLNSSDNGYNLWEHNFANRSTRVLTKCGGPGYLQFSKNGRELYLFSRDQFYTVNQMNGQMRPHGYKAEFELKSSEERTSLFNHVWQQVSDKFYDKDFKNVDWAYYKKAYQRFLPHVNNQFDFAEVLGEMLGELNASHTGASFHVKMQKPSTASFGIYADDSYKGDGIKIAEILEDGPLDRYNSQIKEGMIIMGIDHQKIEKNKDYYPLLEGKAGKRTLVTVYDPATKKTFDQYVKLMSWKYNAGLLYKRWVKQRQDMVDELSNNQIGYIHIASMDSESFRHAYSELLGRYRNRKAVIIDTRFNGGGWLHEDLLHLLGGKKYASFEPRGQFIGNDPFTQWTKPSTVLISESNYSNAHGFPWAYKENKLGKLIGMPVPGTMTAVWWENLINGVTFGIPQVAMKDNKGRVLENMQLEPDIKVNNDPASAMEGRDLQIEAAVKDLLKQIQ